MQSSALFLWLTLSLQTITKPSLSFAQVNAALGFQKKKEHLSKVSEEINFFYLITS